MHVFPRLIHVLILVALKNLLKKKTKSKLKKKLGSTAPRKIAFFTPFPSSQATKDWTIREKVINEVWTVLLILIEHTSLKWNRIEYQINAYLTEIDSLLWSSCYQYAPSLVCVVLVLSILEWRSLYPWSTTHKKLSLSNSTFYYESAYQLFIHFLLQPLPFPYVFETLIQLFGVTIITVDDSGSHPQPCLNSVF